MCPRLSFTLFPKMYRHSMYPTMCHASQWKHAYEGELPRLRSAGSSGGASICRRTTCCPMTISTLAPMMPQFIPGVWRRGESVRIGISIEVVHARADANRLLRVVILHHFYPPAPPRPLHPVHERFDQEDAPPAALAEIFFRSGIGHVGSFESLPLVFDHDLKAPGGDLRLDMDFLARVELVAMLDRVDQRFFHRQLDREGAVVVEARSL